MEKYLELEKHCERIDIISSAASILGWDANVMMPPGAADIRGKQLAEIGVVCHEMFTSNKTKDLLDAINIDELNEWQKANVREIAKSYENSTIIPSDLISALAKATTTCEHIWREARETNNFKMLIPTLKEVLNLNRQYAQIKSEKFNMPKYDCLLDAYDPGMTQEKVDVLFGKLQETLPKLIETIVDLQKSRPKIKPFQAVSVEKQTILAGKLANVVGFDSERGRMDISTHPFCGGCNNDVRITTRYDTSNPISALMGILHESGHAVYEQNRPKDWLYQPVGGARGMSIHESQSLIIEKQAAKTKEFVGYLSKMMSSEFGNYLEYTRNNIYMAVTEVKPSLIRVDADEVTYPAHIIVRYNIEKALINGDMEIEDLPLAFNKGIKDLLGINVPSDKLGCLQDIHWPSGSWGYFPSYTLGAMTAAQLFKAATTQNPDILPSLSIGDMSLLRKWLIENIHSKGCLLSTDDLIKSATGSELDANIFENHLKTRYLS